MSNRQSGLTLLELLISLVLLGFGVLAVAPLFVSALTGTATSADLGWVGAYATERMELLRTQDYGTLTVGGSLVADSSGYVDNPEPGILVRWEVVDNSAAVSGTKVVTVRAMSLRQTRGVARGVTLSTIRGD